MVLRTRPQPIRFPNSLKPEENPTFLVTKPITSLNSTSPLLLLLLLLCHLPSERLLIFQQVERMETVVSELGSSNSTTQTQKLLSHPVIFYVLQRSIIIMTAWIRLMDRELGILISWIFLILSILGPRSIMVSSSSETMPCKSTKLVVYKVSFSTFWDRQKFPKQYPEFRPPAQWSKLIGKICNITNI